MLEGFPQSVYADPANTRPRLLTPGGGVSVAAAAETTVSSVDAARFGYLAQLEAICTVASTTVGTWTLRDASGGATLLVLQQPFAAAAIGTRFVWAFPVPWKTAAIGAVFTVQPSVATNGTWIFMCNGFRSSV